MFKTIKALVQSIMINDRDIPVIDKRDNCIDVLDAALANGFIVIEEWSALMDEVHLIAGE